MVKYQQEDKLGLVFDSLANNVRRGVINSLAYNPSTTTSLAKEFNISTPGMLKHLAILERADLIQQKKAGRTNFVTLNPDTLQIAQDWILKYQTHWGSRKASLENYITTHNNKGLNRRTADDKLTKN